MFLHLLLQAASDNQCIFINYFLPIQRPVFNNSTTDFVHLSFQQWIYLKRNNKMNVFTRGQLCGLLGQLMCTAGVLIDAKRFGCSCFELCSRRKTQILASNVYQTVFRSELLPGTNRFSEISSKDTITYIHSSNYRGVLAACTQLLVPLISPKVCISISTVKY